MPVAAILAVAVMADWAVPMNLSNLIAPAGPAAPAIADPQRYNYGSHFFLAAAWAALFGVSGFLAQGRSTRALVPMLWSASAVLVPLAMLIALYYRIAELDRSLPFAALALLLAAIFAVATETLVQRAPRPGSPASSAIFATGTLAALALALTFALEKGWLTIALALMAPGAAWVAEKRPLPALRWLAAVMVAVTVARIGYEPRIVGTDLGTTPIFNWLLYGYGVPALSFWVAGWLLRRRADDLPARMADAGAILFTVLLVIFEIRHYVTGGDIYRPVERHHRSCARRQCRLGADHRARAHPRTHRQHRAQCRRAAGRGADAVAIVFESDHCRGAALRPRPGRAASSSTPSCSPTACRPCSPSSWR